VNSLWDENLLNGPNGRQDDYSSPMYADAAATAALKEES